MSARPRSPMRSRVHMLTVAAATLERVYANPKLVEDLQAAAMAAAKGKLEGCGWTGEDDKRIERHRTLFNMLPSSSATDRLKEAMLQRAYDLMWDGDAVGCDALVEFLPSSDVDAMFAAWQSDQEAKGDGPRSRYYDREAA